MFRNVSIKWWQMVIKQKVHFCVILPGYWLQVASLCPPSVIKGAAVEVSLLEAGSLTLLHTDTGQRPQVILRYTFGVERSFPSCCGTRLAVPVFVWTKKKSVNLQQRSLYCWRISMSISFSWCTCKYLTAYMYWKRFLCGLLFVTVFLSTVALGLCIRQGVSPMVDR